MQFVHMLQLYGDQREQIWKHFHDDHVQNRRTILRGNCEHCNKGLDRDLNRDSVNMIGFRFTARKLKTRLDAICGAIAAAGLSNRSLSAFKESGRY